MRPVVDVPVDPTGEHPEFTRAKLFFEAPIDVADDRAFFEVAGQPERLAEFVAIRGGPSFDQRVGFALDLFQIGATDSAGANRFFEETFRA